MPGGNQNRFLLKWSKWFERIPVLGHVSFAHCLLKFVQLKMSCDLSRALRQQTHTPIQVAQIYAVRTHRTQKNQKKMKIKMKKRRRRRKKCCKKKNRKSIKKQFTWVAAIFAFSVASFHFVRLLTRSSIYSHFHFISERYRVHLNAGYVWFAEYVRLEFTRLNKWSLRCLLLLLSSLSSHFIVAAK